MSFSKKTWQSNASTPLNVNSMNNLEDRVNNAFEEIGDLTPDYLYQGRELSEFTWEQLQAKAQAGDFSGLKIGDYKTITMNGETVKMQIAGMDTYYGTGPNLYEDMTVGHHIDFISKDCFPTTVQWGSDNNGILAQTNPYLASNLHTWLNDTLYDYLPSDVKDVITRKTTLLETRYSSSGELTDSQSWGWQSLGKLWIPSEFEVFGAVIGGTPRYSAGQAVQYPIFANSWLNRIKCKGDGGYKCDWWTSTAGGGTYTMVCAVSSYGAPDHYVANGKFYTPICFRLAKLQSY